MPEDMKLFGHFDLTPFISIVTHDKIDSRRMRMTFIRRAPTTGLVVLSMLLCLSLFANLGLVYGPSPAPPTVPPYQAPWWPSSPYVFTKFTTVEFQTDVGTVIATPIPGTQRPDGSYQVILSMSVVGAPTQTVRVTNGTIQQAVADYASKISLIDSQKARDHAVQP